MSKFVVLINMSLKVIVFGRLADITGNSLSVKNVADTDSLVNILQKDYPDLANMKFVIAVDKQIINKNTMLNKSSTVALLPPFSGG